ncbi:hypothetical protein, partial [Streptomyces cinereoruber]|uniref:hypothetical protein n=1 Tax=Streptomyces cinereoruber TaxID=67260 RepID=UPI00364C2390
RGPLARFALVAKTVTALTFYRKGWQTPVNRPPGKLLKRNSAVACWQSSAQPLCLAGGGNRTF